MHEDSYVRLCLILLQQMDLISRCFCGATRVEGEPAISRCEGVL